MRRLLGPVAVAGVLALLVLAPVTLADTRDPRCDAWEAGAPPPGIDMAAVCPSITGVTTADVDLGREPLMPYVVALLVAAVVLSAVGVVAMRVTAKPAPGRRSSAAWWTCAGCGATNQPRRTACFACQEPRGDPTAAQGTATHPA